MKVSVAAAPSGSVSDAIDDFDFNLDENKAYSIVAAGVVGNTGATAFNLFVKPDALTSSTSGSNISVQVFHGSPDAPEVDVILPNGTVLVDNLSFGEFSNYITVPSADYTLYITPANDNSVIVGAYVLEKSPSIFPIPIDGQALTIFASGFLSGSPSFELWLTRQSGTTYPLSATVSTGDLAKNVAEFSLQPNPATDVATALFEVKKADGAMTVSLVNALGQVVASQNLGDQKGQISHDFDLAGLPTGLYQVVLQNAAGQMAKRLVVAR